MNRADVYRAMAASALSEIALFAFTRFKRLRRHAISFAIRKRRFRKFASIRHCEEPTGPAFSRPDDKLRDEAIQFLLPDSWIASRSLSSGGASRRPVGSQ
jgi:hypothetical protein